MTAPTVTKELAAAPPPAAQLVVQPEPELDVERIIREQEQIDKLIARRFQDGVHFGVIPGTEKKDKKPGEVDKPVLYQAGAELLCHLFRFRPEFEVVREILEPKLIYYRVRARLYHMTSGILVGEAVGSANSREKKYVNQTLARSCPACGKPAIIRSKKSDGWYCLPAKQGCGKSFKPGDPSIEEQAGDQVVEAVWDLDNTIFKIACKRGFVSAARSATGVSGRFDVDLEDRDLDDDEDDQRAAQRGGKNTANTQPAQQRQQAAAQAGGGNANAQPKAEAGEKTPGPEPTAGAGTPGPAMMSPDDFDAIDKARTEAGMSTRDMYRLVESVTGKKRMPEMTAEDAKKVVAELRKVQEESGGGAA